MHFDHKGPLHPTGASNAHCLLIVDAFSRVLMVYPVRNTTALAAIAAVEKKAPFRWNPKINHTRSKHRFYQCGIRQLD